MARQNHPVADLLGPYGAGVQLTQLGPDIVNDEEFEFTGREIILYDTFASINPTTFTIETADNELGRQGDIATQVSDFAQGMQGPFNKDGFIQGGKILFNSSTDDGQLIMVFRLPQLYVE